MSLALKDINLQAFLLLCAKFSITMRIFGKKQKFNNYHALHKKWSYRTIPLFLILKKSNIWSTLISTYPLSKPPPHHLTSRCTHGKEILFAAAHLWLAKSVKISWLGRRRGRAVALSSLFCIVGGGWALPPPACHGFPPDGPSLPSPLSSLYPLPPPPPASPPFYRQVWLRYL